MLLSMTSYGRSSAPTGDKQVVIEIKTLNSKFIDLRLKLPASLNDKEMWLRKHLQEKMLRGKVEVVIGFQNQEGGETYEINHSAFKQYHTQLTSISDELGLANPDFLSSILRLPDVVASSDEALSEEEWSITQEALTLALDKVQHHRKEEGVSIETDLSKQIHLILEYMAKIDPLEQDRVSKVRQRMSNNLDEYLKRENVDENRFEQEVLFYLEKIDITEEKVRLRQHCDYFLQELGNAEILKGRKLNFISQEIGREINTLGAKAYSSEIQKCVVLMKDALEKIKEQLANVV